MQGREVHASRPPSSVSGPAALARAEGTATRPERSGRVAVPARGSLAVVPTRHHSGERLRAVGVQRRGESGDLRVVSLNHGSSLCRCPMTDRRMLRTWARPRRKRERIPSSSQDPARASSAPPRSGPAKSEEPASRPALLRRSSPQRRTPRFGTRGPCGRPGTGGNRCQR